MGWLFQNDKLRHQTPEQYITKQFTYDGKTSSAIVVAAATVGSTIYAAIRNENKALGTSYVFCAVILFKNNDRDGFGYKDMDESMGPNEVNCPDRIMRLLSPISAMPSPGYAADWRERVAAAKTARATLRKKRSTLAVGSVITLTTPATFGDRVTADRFTLVAFQKRTPIFTPISHPGFRCRLRAATIATATIE